MAKVFDLDMLDLPEGSTPLEAVVMITCLNAEGNQRMITRSTSGIMGWEVVGLLVAGTDLYREAIRNAWKTEE